MSQCANCDGQQWVCENHPEVPWNEGDGCCGGAGMPCTCNSLYEESTIPPTYGATVGGA